MTSRAPPLRFWYFKNGLETTLFELASTGLPQYAETTKMRSTRRDDLKNDQT
jgi:hypothetical protein